jgi:hypothetical protein
VFIFSNLTGELLNSLNSSIRENMVKRPELLGLFEGKPDENPNNTHDRFSSPS